jgi:serine/threonine-protein kinase RsbW
MPPGLATERDPLEAMAHSFAAWTIDRTIPSELEVGHRLLEEMLGKIQAENWSARDQFGLRLALEEAVVNAIKHGNCLDAAKTVHVECRSTPDKIWIRVSDQGRGFNPDAVPDCTDPDRIDVPSGRGIMLMRNFMTRVEYSDRGNVVTMEKLRGEDSD